VKFERPDTFAFLGIELVRVNARVRISTGYRTMKSREAALRLKRFEADEKSRKVQDLEYMIRDLELVAADLDRQIAAEEERTGIKDPSHFNYSTFARSAAQRRDNLKTSIAGLVAKLEPAQRERNDALEQYERFAADSMPRDSRQNGTAAPRTTGNRVSTEAVR
jgi:flagellar protein FliJ